MIDETATAPQPAAQPEPPLHFPVDLPALLRHLEEAYIEAALKQTAGNRKAAADLLGLQRTTLVEKLRRRSREVPAVVLPEAGPVAAG
jgi:sigma-54 specific flagellar transcriptional regulator A